MPINPEAVGAKGAPSKRSWTSKDALLYAVGIGAGTDELQYTTENTKNIDQKVFPTFAVIVGGGGIPMREVGSFNPTLMVHGEQGIELLSEIPQREKSKVLASARPSTIREARPFSSLPLSLKMLRQEKSCLELGHRFFVEAKEAGAVTGDPQKKFSFRVVRRINR